MEDNNENRNIEKIISDVVSHPSFRRRIEEVTGIRSGEITEITTNNNNPTNYSSSRVTASSVPNTSCNIQQQNTNYSATTVSATPSFQSPSQELSSIFLRGSSRRTGASSSRNNTTSSGKKRKIPFSSPNQSSSPKLNPEFRTKEVVLLPSSNESQIVKGKRKQSLMANGFVRSELTMKKEWTENEVLNFFANIFEEKLQNIPCSSSGYK